MSQGQGVGVATASGPSAASQQGDTDQNQWQQEQRLIQMGALQAPAFVPAQAAQVNSPGMAPGIADAGQSIGAGLKKYLQQPDVMPGTQFDIQGIPMAQAVSLGGQ